MRVLLIRGAGDLASGIAHRLRSAGLPVVMNDLPKPTMIRRTVSFGAAIYEGQIEIEGIKAVHTAAKEAQSVCEKGDIPVLTESYEELLQYFQPEVVIDAILAKRNLGTSKDDAPIVIGVGPGFSAPEDVHMAVETKRGHYLGKVYTQGSPIPNTGIPGNIGGYTVERVLHAPAAGIFRAVRRIGDTVAAGDILAYIGDVPVPATISGVLRGLLQDGLTVPQGMKIGDIDSRCEIDHCWTISDKARAVGGGVLEAVLKGGWLHA